MTFFLVPLGIAFDYIAIAVARIEYILIKPCPVTIHERCFCFATPIANLRKCRLIELNSYKVCLYLIFVESN